MKKRLIQSFLLSASALLLLISVIFAWYTLSPSAGIEDFIVNVNKYDAILKLEVRKNGNEEDEYIEVLTQADIQEVFYNTIPNDYLYFRFTVTNNSNNNITANIWLNDIRSINHSDYNMLNVFYLDGDGKIKVDNLDYELPGVDNISNEEVVLYGQTLETYRLSNILVNSRVNLVSSLAFAANESKTIDFIIVFDYNTEAKGYEGGTLYIGSINAIFNTNGE